MVIFKKSATEEEIRKYASDVNSNGVCYLSLLPLSHDPIGVHHVGGNVKDVWTSSMKVRPTARPYCDEANTYTGLLGGDPVELHQHTAVLRR